MPYKSDAQRRKFHAMEERGEISPKVVHEFDEASKGKTLPERVPQKMDEGGLVDMVRHALLGDKAETAVKHDASEAAAADAIDPVIKASSDTAKGYAEGGEVDKDEPGLQDATVSDFLLPFMLGRSANIMEGASSRLADEAGSILPQKAPIMGDAVAGATTRDALPGQVEVYVKGVQKGMPEKGIDDIKIYGVKGDPAKLKELFGEEAPGSVPEHVLQQKGLLPIQTGFTPQASPNAYAEGGRVERSSLEHPTPNAMMARAMSDGGYANGGYPHVSFLENETPAEVKKDTHREGHEAAPVTTTETGEKENPVHMAEGGKTPHFLEGLKKGALHKEMGIAESKKIPEAKLEKAANSDNETLRKRAQFAINAKKFHHSDGGLIEGLKRDKEPAKRANVEPSHEEKLKSIYKVMGMKKYADGGAVVPNDVDVSQLPSPTTAPSPSDPGFWDSIKAALSQVGKPIQAAMAPAQAINTTVAPAVAPAAAGAINSLTGASLPVPPPMASPTPSLPPPTAPATVAAPAIAPKTPVVAPVTSDAAPTGVDLRNIFNQDTSKLTQGVNPEDRQALASQMQAQQHSFPSILAQAVAGLGDALAAKGGRDQHSLQNIFSMQKEQRAEAMANFDQARQDRLQKLDLQTKMGNNALAGLAAQDAYGTDEHLNKMLGAPAGTAHKDLPLYFQARAAQVAQAEKDADLYMKAHSQAASEVDAATKNASVLGIKPSAAQLQASGQKLADNYYNRAKGNILVRPSDGGPAQWIPAVNINKARQMDPNLQIIPG